MQGELELDTAHGTCRRAARALLSRGCASTGRLMHTHTIVHVITLGHWLTLAWCELEGPTHLPRAKANPMHSVHPVAA